MDEALTLASASRCDMGSACLPRRSLLWNEIVFGEQDVSERIAIQRVNECVERLIQDIRQLAALGDDAPTPGGKALDQGKIRLGRTHDGAKIDVLRSLRKREPA